MNFYKAYDLDDRWAIAFTRDFDRAEPVVYFLDKKYKHTNVCGIECQITCGAYYVSTLLGHDDNYDLCLAGDSPEWTVPAETVALAKKYCQKELHGNGIQNSRKAIKSSRYIKSWNYDFYGDSGNAHGNLNLDFEVLNVGGKDIPPTTNFYQDIYEKHYMTEEYAKNIYSDDEIKSGSRSGELIKMIGINGILKRLADVCGLALSDNDENNIDQMEYSVNGNQLEITVYPKNNSSLNRGWWDTYSVKNAMCADEQVPIIEGDNTKVAMTVTMTILGLDSLIGSSRKPVKSSDDRMGKDIGMTSNGQEIKIGESSDGNYRIYKDTHRGAYYLTERNNVKDMISFNAPSVETRLERWAAIYDIELGHEYLSNSRKPIKSAVSDDKWELVNELCDRAIAEMNGDRDAMFFTKMSNGFLIKGKYIDEYESSTGITNPHKLWKKIVMILDMDKLLSITEGIFRKYYELGVKWVGEEY